MKPTIVAIIPARRDSKSIPGKNKKTLLGKPLIHYTMNAALQSKHISQVVVTTNDNDIKQMATAKQIIVVDRPDRLATDTSRSEMAVLHCLQSLQKKGQVFEYFMLLQPTSPLRTALHIDDCCQQFLSTTNNTVVSITENHHHPYKSLLIKNHQLVPIKNWRHLNSPRQKLPASVYPNGAIYMLSVVQFIEKKSFFIPPIMGYKMEADASIDIDTELDFQMAALLMKSS